MYIKRFQLENFRKFRDCNNYIEFVDSQGMKKAKDNDINIASSTTMIVGKNNSGKTTILEALYKICNGESFSADDFNYGFIKHLTKQYLNGQFEETPFIEFTITVGLDKRKDDYIVNIAPFLTISNSSDEINIIIKYELKERELFINKVKDAFGTENDESILFTRLMNTINEEEFTTKYLTESKQEVKKFKLNKLIEFVKIKANSVTNDSCLSDAFNKIISYRHNNNEGLKSKDIDKKIDDINTDLSKQFKASHSQGVNDTLSTITDSNLKVNLSADLTFEKVLKNIIKYQYIENDNYIPETQFGLGYTNLMVIISKLIEYMEKYPDGSINSKINIIGIEEPETFMHPQLQELFIRNINEAISTLLEKHKKNINTQLLISTHSSHILNSKIHAGGSFNCINYIKSEDGTAKVVTLNDGKIAGDVNTQSKEFKFIKKHMTFRMSDVFFADAVILTEGTSENILLPYFLSKDDRINKKYISIIQVNGSHALVYNNLMKLLGIPCLIITDLDIIRSSDEKKNHTQISSLTGRETSNNTIKKYNSDSYILNNNIKPIQDDNLFITFQKKTNGYYPTSFEEAFILKNYKNKLFNTILKSVKRNIYSRIVTKDKILSNNRDNSYKWQVYLSKDKTKLANETLFQIIITDDKSIKLPKYIYNGFDFIAENIK